MRTTVAPGTLLLLLLLGCDDGAIYAPRSISQEPTTFPLFEQDPWGSEPYRVAIEGVGIAEDEVRLSVVLFGFHHPTAVDLLLSIRDPHGQSVGFPTLVSSDRGAWCGEPAVRLYRGEDSPAFWIIQRTAGDDDCGCPAEPAGPFRIVTFVLKTPPGRWRVSLIANTGRVCDCDLGCLTDAELDGGWITDRPPAP